MSKKDEFDLLVEQVEQEDFDAPYECPVCGAECDDYQSCGCYEEIHYGKD